MSRRDIEAIQAEADHITNESLESTRRMVQYATESQDIASKTLSVLDEQGEQLRRIEGTQNKIDAENKRAERQLNELDKCCGIVCPCNKKKSIVDSRGHQKAFGKGRAGDGPRGADGVITDQPRSDGVVSARGKTAAGNAGSFESQRYIDPILKDDREDEMNSNLSAVSSMVANLKKQAETMGDELDDQNKVIDRINDKTAVNIKSTYQLTDRAARKL